MNMKGDCYMASVTERRLKDGTRVYEIRVSRGRDPLTGKQLTPYSTRYTPPATWSAKRHTNRLSWKRLLLKLIVKLVRYSPEQRKSNRNRTNLTKQNASGLRKPESRHSSGM